MGNVRSCVQDIEGSSFEEIPSSVRGQRAHSWHEPDNPRLFSTSLERCTKPNNTTEDDVDEMQPLTSFTTPKGVRKCSNSEDFMLAGHNVRRERWGPTLCVSAPMFQHTTNNTRAQE